MESIRKIRMRLYWFPIRNEAFFVLARKSRGCAEAYIGTPHKQTRRLTPPGRKRTVSGWKLFGEPALVILVAQMAAHRAGGRFDGMFGGERNPPLLIVTFRTTQVRRLLPIQTFYANANN